MTRGSQLDLLRSFGFNRLSMGVQDFDPDVAERIVDRLVRFKPIYVEIDRITFDGLRGASQPWNQSINAGEFGVGMWSGPVDARTFAASQPWNQGIVADTA